MQNKKLYIILAVVVIVVAGAAFVGGRFLNGQAGPLGLLPFGPNGGGRVSIAVNMTPAPELPVTRPEVTGTFVERNDNTITIQSVSMEMGGKGGIVLSTGPDSGGGPSNSTMGGDGPKVDVVITNETKIYRDATDMGEPPKSGNETITVQQVMEPGTLDDLKNQTMVMVWGRKNGDRIIADVISYSNPVIFKK
jgi:hypothetical protein